MAKHEFGIMRTAPRAHERYDLYEPDKYRCISVPDETVEPLLERLSAVECFWHTLQHPGKGLAYAGITLIPPASLAELLRCLAINLDSDTLHQE